MNWRRRMVLAFPLLGVLPVCLPKALASDVSGKNDLLVRRSAALMGTRVDVAVSLHDAVRREQAELAIDAALARMLTLERLMSRFHADSEVARIGAAAGIAPVHVAPEVMQVLKHAQHLHAASDGAFDITIGALRGWSFEPGREQAPARDEIARELAMVNMGGLLLDEQAATAYLKRKGMALDLGGIAKLPILQAGLDVLQERGFGNTLINGGGDVLAGGTHGGKAWRVGVRDPNAPQQLLGVIELKGRGIVASSGDYERSFIRDGQQLHHVLDPRTGWPTRGVHGVALRADRVGEVNGWGAALMVRGAKSLEPFAARHSAVDVLAGLSDGTHWLSGGMQRKLTRA